MELGALPAELLPSGAQRTVGTERVNDSKKLTSVSKLRRREAALYHGSAPRSERRLCSFTGVLGGHARGTCPFAPVPRAVCAEGDEQEETDDSAHDTTYDSGDARLASGA